MTKVSTFKKYLLPLIIIGIFIGLAVVISQNPPKGDRASLSNVPQLNVDVITVKAAPLTINISSYGTVQPRTQSNLFPQVSGQIVQVNKNFNDGGFFEQGDVLVTLDNRDYIADVKIFESNLLLAKQQLSEEQARVTQAKQDWLRLGNNENAPDLVLRKPQLLAAKANVLSAQASLNKAKLALERTDILAPYTGRILKKEVDLGQVVSSNTRLAQLYAVDYVEIRLPIKNNDLAFMTLPEASRYQQIDKNQQPDVTFVSDLNKQQQWLGKVVRTEGAFDQASQQLFVVAQIDNPYGTYDTNGLPIKIGQYVTADIRGKTIESALTIPNNAIYQGSYVYIVEQGKLQRKHISIAWQNSNKAMISEGLSIDEQLVITPLGQVNSGTPVAISNVDGVLMAKREKSKKDHHKKAHGANL